MSRERLGNVLSQKNPLFIFRPELLLAILRAQHCCPRCHPPRDRAQCCCPRRRPPPSTLLLLPRAARSVAGEGGGAPLLDRGEGERENGQRE